MTENSQAARDDRFIDPQLGIDTMAVYHARRSIYDALIRHRSRLTGELLDVGCGQSPYRAMLCEDGTVTRYIGMDLPGTKYGDSEVAWDGRTMPLADESVDSALVTEVLEHCPDPTAVMREARRVLRPAGSAVVTVPFLWPIHDAPYDEHRYTPFALKRILEDAGFVTVTIESLGGWHASMAQMMGLWVSRAPMSNGKRRWLSRLLLPIMRRLYRRDRRPDATATQVMHTGLLAIAEKGGHAEHA